MVRVQILGSLVRKRALYLIFLIARAAPRMRHAWSLRRTQKALPRRHASLISAHGTPAGDKIFGLRIKYVIFSPAHKRRYFNRLLCALRAERRECVLQHGAILISFYRTTRAGPQIIKKDFARRLPVEYSFVSRNKKSLLRRISCGAEFIALQNMRSGEHSCKAVGLSQRRCMQPARPSSRAGQSN